MSSFIGMCIFVAGVCLFIGVKTLMKQASRLNKDLAELGSAIVIVSGLALCVPWLYDLPFRWKGDGVSTIAPITFGSICVTVAVGLWLLADSALNVRDELRERNRQHELQ